jgi:phage/plasmid-associated DNA primase
MKLTDLLKIHKVPYLALNIKFVVDKNGDMVKCRNSILEQTPKGWKEWDYEKCMEYNKNKNNYKHIQVNLSKSPFMVMDNDEPSVNEEFMSVYGNELATQSIGKGLCHAWFKKDENDCCSDLTDAYSNNQEVLKHDPFLVKTDLRYTNIFEKIDAEIIVPPEIRVFDFKNEHPSAKKKEQGSNVSREYNNENKNKNEDIDLMIELGLLDDKLYSYTEWFDLLCAFKRVGIPYSQFDELSRRNMNNYDCEKNKEIWDKTDVSTHGYNIGSIINWCRDKDEKLYNDYFNYFIPKNIFNELNIGIAIYLVPKFRNLVFGGDKWYKYDNKKCIWFSMKEPTAIVIEVLMKCMNTTISYYTKKLADEKDEKEKEKLDKLIYAEGSGLIDTKFKMTNGNYTSQFIKILKDKLYDSEFYKKLDNLKYKLAFQNGIFDIKTGTFRYGLRYNDYITDYIHRDFHFEEDKEKIDFIEKTIFNICNCDEEQATYYKSVLGYSLCGDAEKEKEIYFIIGQGANNGKTTLLEAMKDAMPSVVGSMNNQVLLANYQKSHKFLPMLEKKIIYVEELQKGKELNTSLLKEIRDGKSLSNEVMFGTSRQINVSSKVFILSNNIPVFKTDNGISTCLRQLQFNNKFLKEESEDYHKVGNVSGYLKADKDLADKLKGDYFIPLMNVLLKYSFMYSQEQKLKPIPQFYIEKAKETCNANDTLKAFWEDEIIIGENHKLSKEQLLKECSNKDIIAFIEEKGYKYDKCMKNGNWKRGGWRGITLKDNIEDEENEN